MQSGDSVEVHRMILFRMKLMATVASALLATTLLPGAAYAQATALGAYNAPLTETSVSGISSGAYMSVQFATAWSSVIKGVGAIAGGPYGCAGGSAATALSSCMMGQPPVDTVGLYKRADAHAATGRIDNPANIASQKVYLFSGYNDAVVHRPVTNWLDASYREQLGQNAGNLFYQTAVGAGHSQVTLTYGSACAANGGHYIDDCDYDQAGVILQHIYGALTPPNRGRLRGALLAFSQEAYTAPAKPADLSMGDKAFVFVPADCASGTRCRVHIALHGCKQSYDDLGEDFVRHAGYNEWADANHVIVLYPQTTPRAGMAPFFGVTNPEGCWDWWGYLDKDPTSDPRYLTRDAPQIMAIKSMIDRLTRGAKPPVPVSRSAGFALVVNDVSDRAIALAWTEVPAALSYEVFRAGPGQAELTRVAAGNGLSFGDAALRPKTVYRYQVRPILASGPGTFTGIVTQRTRASPPICTEPGTCKVVKWDVSATR